MIERIKNIFAGTPEQQASDIKANIAYEIFLRNMMPIYLLILGLFHFSFLIIPLMLSLYFYMNYLKSKTRISSPFLNYSMFWLGSTWLHALIGCLVLTRILHFGFLIALMFVFFAIAYLGGFYDYRDENP